MVLMAMSSKVLLRTTPSSPVGISTMARRKGFALHNTPNTPQMVSTPLAARLEPEVRNRGAKNDPIFRPP